MSLYENVMHACCMLMLLIPILFISVIYMHILITVYHMNSVEGKVFTTCSSHIMLVSMFYGTAFYTNVLPRSYHMPEKDKVVSAFYTILNPMLNPLIYSLRNKEVASALRKVLGRCASSQRIRAGDVFRKY
ncbi:Olfactory receptor 2T35 [Sciurus carolinensis]|uniref:Olfactory receptor 2T35 n=1 Tax=Sciurus carolinensis TaxID=30640 RepID=A0AA41MLD5_SCICA|nr:Olfactory receptor 2T35 [Sciurus carolinensis]